MFETVIDVSYYPRITLRWQHILCWPPYIIDFLILLYMFYGSDRCLRHKDQATLLTPFVIGMKCLTLNPVSGTKDHV
jgi:hypothetical protein